MQLITPYWRTRRERQDAALAGRDGRKNRHIKDFSWIKDTLKAGAKITLTGRKVKSGAPYMNLTDRGTVVMIDAGKEIFRTPNYGTHVPKRPALQQRAPQPNSSRLRKRFSHR